MSMALVQEPQAQAGWDLAQGDEIVPGLTAMRLLGGPLVHAGGGEAGPPGSG
jgi:hypothetical protein